MKTRPLGQDGPQVSEIGFGAWVLGSQWGGQNDADSIAAIHAALDQGINFIDTAAGYGDGHSERIIAKALENRRDEVFVATKTPPDAGPWPPSPYCRWQDRYSAAYLRDNVHTRLQNLGVERIDLLQLHTWTRAWNEDPQPLMVLRQLRDEGKVNLIGVSTPEHDQSCVIELMRDGLVDVIQIIYNLFDQEAVAQILPVAAQTGTGVIVRAALDEGALTGKYKAGHKFPENDFRHQYFAGDRLERTVERVEQIRQDLAASTVADQCTLSDVALKFVLNRPEVSTVIVGMRNEAQVRLVAPVSEMPDLPPPLVRQLRRHHWRRGIWYGGK